MDTKQAKEVSWILQDIEVAEIQLKKLDKHSFGFGTSYRDIDDYLRPQAKFYLEAKIEKLKSRLKDY